jgi:hypothetical protein
MPMIQLDVQPLTQAQRDELRRRAVGVVVNAIGSPDRYVSVIIREHEHVQLVEAGGMGPYDARELIEQPFPEPAAEAHGDR